MYRQVDTQFFLFSVVLNFSFALLSKNIFNKQEIAHENHETNFSTLKLYFYLYFGIGT